MITKERIDELIQQRAKVWGVGKQGNVFCVGLKFRPETLKNKKWIENKYEVYGKLFETKAEAEWHAEFGCIERTDRLELPTWEEFWNSGQTIWFTGKDGGQYSLSIYNREILLNDTYIGYLDKENYTLACRKCKELFLGESK